MRDRSPNVTRSVEGTRRPRPQSPWPIPPLLRSTVPVSPSQPLSRLRDQPLLPLPSASDATGAGSLSTGIQTDLPPPRDERDSPERRYLRGVLGRYLWLPGIPVQSSRYDRRLARTLLARGVSLISVEAALLLGATRRALRDPHLAPLPRVRSLSYFLPVLTEVLENPRPPDLDYLTCLLRRLRPLAELKAAQLAHMRLCGER